MGILSKRIPIRRMASSEITHTNNVAHFLPKDKNKSFNSINNNSNPEIHSNTNLLIESTTSIIPNPEKYDQYVINSYALPRLLVGVSKENNIDEDIDNRYKKQSG
jgi:hypothetical protein